MIQKIRLSASIKIWDRSLSASTIQDAFGLKASLHHSVGERRKLGDHKPYKETYCMFRILGPKLTTSEAAVERCLDVIEKEKVLRLVRKGGELYVVIGVFDRILVDFILEESLVARLAAARAGLHIASRTE